MAGGSWGLKLPSSRVQSSLCPLAQCRRQQGFKQVTLSRGQLMPRSWWLCSASYVSGALLRQRPQDGLGPGAAKLSSDARGHPRRRPGDTICFW